MSSRIARMFATLVVALGSVAADAYELTISAVPSTAVAGQVVAFTFTPVVIQPGDTVTLDFGDGESATVEYTVGCGLIGGCSSLAHTYAGRGTYTVSGTGTLSGSEFAGSLQLTVTEPPMDKNLYVGTAGHLPGRNQTVWRTDLTIHNPGPTKATYEISLLVRDRDNTLPDVKTFTLNPLASITYPDVLDSVFSFEGAAALRIVNREGEVAAISRTYNALQSGSYGQFQPVIQRGDLIGDGQVGRVIGVFNEPSLKSGFRTNLGLVNASPASVTVEVVIYSRLGVVLGRPNYELLPYDHRQIDRITEEVTEDPVEDGFLLVRSLTLGARVLAYAAMVDNITGDPVYQPAKVIPAGTY